MSYRMLRLFNYTIKNLKRSNLWKKKSVIYDTRIVKCKGEYQAFLLFLKCSTQFMYRYPYWKIFTNQYQNNTRTSKKFTSTSIKHIDSGIILILVYETFPIGLNDYKIVGKKKKEYFLVNTFFHTHTGKRNKLVCCGHHKTFFYINQLY